MCSNGSILWLISSSKYSSLIHSLNTLKSRSPNGKQDFHPRAPEYFRSGIFPSSTTGTQRACTRSAHRFPITADRAGDKG